MAARRRLATGAQDTILPHNMRVAIEAASLALTSGGLARYTSELSLALAHCFPEDEFFLVSDQPFRMPEEAPANLKRGGGARSAVERRWWLWGLPREMARLGADLIHGPDFAVPYLARRPSVLTLHDLSPWMDQRWHHAAHRVRRRTPVLLELGIATMIITPSEAVRKQAIERFRLRPDRIVAIPEAAAPWMRPVDSPTRQADQGVGVPSGPGPGGPPHTGPYFLFVGTLEPRKNLPCLMNAWREVRRHHPIDLVLAGRRRSDFAPLPEEPGLRLLGEVPNASLPSLYSGALALVYPSLYEGFGLPVLEAMQCGSPVIASSAVAEAAGDAAIYADDPPALARAMRQIAERPEWRAEWRARSLERARQFSWERTARMTQIGRAHV
jgi:glycosyltransferase involved in cell wall biosynthesis